MMAAIARWLARRRALRAYKRALREFWEEY